MTVYIDMLFAINLIMNTIIFYIVSKIMKISRSLKKIILGAAISSFLYCVLLIFFNQYFNFFTALLILVFGLFVTFGIIGLKKFIMLIIWSHLSAFLIGGMAVALYNYFNINMFFRVMYHFPVGILIISIFLTYIALSLGNIYIQKIRLSKRVYYTIQIFNDNKSVDIVALVDTGNSLVEPISKWPVIIAEQKSVNKIVSLENIGDKMRLIPYKTVGKEGILTGFRPDKVIILCDKQIELNEVVIGLCDFNLGNNYQGLLNPQFLEVN